MNTNFIQQKLFELRDKKYAEFTSKIIPGIAPDLIIGIRTPILRTMAKKMPQDTQFEFIKNIPHKYFEENQLHAFILSGIRDFETCACAVDSFLPYIDNWATCDQMTPKSFEKNTECLLPYIKKWISSKSPYSVRFGIVCLMRYYLGDKFVPQYANMVANVKSNEYYINMVRAWYFATALAKNWDDIVPIIEQRILDKWTHNKTIQKACESFRISPEQKIYLKQYKFL